MSAVSSLKFRMRNSDGIERELIVDSERALIGSGAHCEIRLLPEDAAVDQLRVQVQSGGVFAEALCLNPPALLNGVPFTEGRILPESVLEIGRVRLQIQVSQTDFAPDAGTGKKRPRISVIHVLGLVGFPLGFYALSLAPKKDADGVRVVEPPTLFASDVKPACPQASSAQASAVAADELALADAESERAPFYAEDGVSAVAHYERSAACFRLGGDAASADLAERQAASSKSKLKDEFHVHQVRLERALATREYDRARTEIHMLLSFVAGQPGEYSTYLSTLDRRIQMKYSGDNKEER